MIKLKSDVKTVKWTSDETLKIKSQVEEKNQQRILFV